MVRDEPFTDPPEMQVPRRVAKEVNDYYTEQYEEEMAYERAFEKTGRRPEAARRQGAQGNVESQGVPEAETPS